MPAHMTHKHNGTVGACDGSMARAWKAQALHRVGSVEPLLEVERMILRCFFAVCFQSFLLLCGLTGNLPNQI